MDAVAEIDERRGDVVGLRGRVLSRFTGQRTHNWPNSSAKSRPCLTCERFLWGVNGCKSVCFFWLKSGGDSGWNPSSSAWAPSRWPSCCSPTRNGWRTTTTCGSIAPGTSTPRRPAVASGTRRTSTFRRRLPQVRHERCRRPGRPLRLRLRVLPAVVELRAWRTWAFLGLVPWILVLLAEGESLHPASGVDHCAWSTPSSFWYPLMSSNYVIGLRKCTGHWEALDKKHPILYYCAR